MRRYTTFLAAALALSAIAFPGPVASGAAASIRIKLATLAPKGTSYHRLLLEMGEKWRRASGGLVDLTIYPGGAIGSEADTVKRMNVGQLQAGMLTVGGLSEIDPAVAALQEIPMLFRSLDEAEYVREQLRPDLEKRLLAKGYVALDWTDVLLQLKTHGVDAVPAPPVIALSGQYYMVTKHMTEVNWVPLVGATVVTKQAWDQIPQATRDLLMPAAAEAGRRIQEAGRQENDNAVQEMKKLGVEVHAVPPPVERDAAVRPLCEFSEFCVECRRSRDHLASFFLASGRANALFTLCAFDASASA